MIRSDTITIGFTMSAIMISVYLATFERGFIAIFPAILLIGGLTMSHYVLGRFEQVDGIFTTHTKDIILYSLMALAGISVGALVGRNILFPAAYFGLDLLPYQTKLYGVLMAVAEEQFFRGFITNMLLWKLPNPVLAIISSGGIFTVYHLAVYGAAADAMIYIFIAGIVLSYVAWKSGRLSPVILAHALNNIWVS